MSSLRGCEQARRRLVITGSLTFLLNLSTTGLTFSPRPGLDSQDSVIMVGMDEVFGLFPTPFLRAPGTLSARLVDGLMRHFSALALEANKASGNLSHTEMLRPGDSPLLVEAATLITPKIVDMGALMFGDRLDWAIKEMWVNVLDTGGLQAMHKHANSFVSGVVYLTATHPASQTVFMKSSGSTEFVFKHEHASITPTPFNADRWVSPAP